MAGIESTIQSLKNYQGRTLTLMEVCGTHTSAIMKNGIREHLSPFIRLVSGPAAPYVSLPLHILIMPSASPLWRSMFW